jgi:TrmH family RNA methyltransferase
VSDPGNLGTIIRLADWYGIDQVICSEDCVDLYNSKTVQATMASIARVNVLYTNLMDFLNQNERPVYFADMHGDNIYENPLPAEALLVMGSESHGVSEEIRKFGKVVSIPSFSKHKSTESLNVAVATSILVSEWMRITGK